MRKILIVDDVDSVRYSFKKLFREPDYRVIDAANGPEGLKLFSKESPDLVVLDIEMPGMNGIEVIKRMKAMAPQVPVLIVTAFGTTERVIDAMKFGAYEYLEKPFDIARLRSTITEALEMKSMTEGGLTVGASDQVAGGLDTIVGNSHAIKEVYKMIGRVAASDANILLVGESGTGKELAAKAIHRYSNRADKPFMTINCAAIPDTLLESELFGYEKGSFTDATKSKVGKFEQADTGTLFLDEIGDMSLPLQAKLLRVLQEGTFERLGGNKTIKVNVRIIAATNKHLENAILKKEFREDLYYRLKVITITLPPLRMRTEDIPLLARYFISKYGQQMHKQSVSVLPETMDKLVSHHWPGNVRELENVLKRAVLLSKNNVITPDLIEEDVSVLKPEQKSSQEDNFASVIPENIGDLEGNLYEHVIGKAEREVIKLALRYAKGNQVKAAKILGISRPMLHLRIAKYGIEPQIYFKKE